MHKLQSLGRQTDLIFSRFNGDVIDRGDFILVRDQSNPSYHWGNFLIFPNAPQAGDYSRWMQLFANEFDCNGKSPAHRLFAWDVTDQDQLGASQEFIEHGMVLDQAVVLATSKVKSAPRPNSEVQIRTIEEDEEWQQAIDLQILTREEEYSFEAYSIFKNAQFANYRRMVKAKMGNWYAAFQGKQMVANLGIFHENSIARYQSVTTHPSHRCQGICATLVHKSAALIGEQASISKFVMEADPEYHAARIYESVGFSAVEKNHALHWHSEMKKD